MIISMSCSSFPQTPVPVLASLLTKINAYPIMADYLKGHVTTTSTQILHRKGGLIDSTNSERGEGGRERE